MKTIIKLNITIIFILLLCSFGYSSVIYYDDPISIGIGARAIGMGRAFNAVADDSNAVFMNPAGLGTQRNWNLSSMQTDFIQEYPYTMISGVIPRKDMGTFGFGYVNSRSKDILVTDGGTAFSYNQALIVSYGGYVGNTFKPLLGNEYNLYSGASLKYFSKGFSGNVTANAIGYNVDYGLKYIANDRLAFGFTLYNLLYGSKVIGDIEPEDMPGVIRLGGAYDIKEINLLVVADKEFHFGRDIPWPSHLGLEWHGNEYIYLRAGVDQIMGGAGDALNNATTLGIGLEYDGLRIDLAYMNNFSDIGAASTFLSVSYFDRTMEEVAVEKKPEPVKIVTEPKKAPAPVPSPTKEAESAVPKGETSKRIFISFPSKDALTYIKDIQIAGSVEASFEGTLWLDGKNIEIQQDGMFTTYIPLDIGMNEKVLRLIDGNVLEAVAQRRIYRYYIPADLTKGEAEQKPVESIIIFTKIYEYLAKDYTLDKKLSRQIMALIIGKAKKLAVTPEAESVALDVSKDHWAASYITGVIRAGVMFPYSDGNFLPDKMISKFELAEIMSKATGKNIDDMFSYLLGKPLDDFATFGDLTDLIYYTGYLSEDIKGIRKDMGI